MYTKGWCSVHSHFRCAHTGPDSQTRLSLRQSREAIVQLWRSEVHYLGIGELPAGGHRLSLSLLFPPFFWCGFTAGIRDVWQGKETKFHYKNPQLALGTGGGMDRSHKLEPFRNRSEVIPELASWDWDLQMPPSWPMYCTEKGLATRRI